MPRPPSRRSSPPSAVRSRSPARTAPASRKHAAAPGSASASASATRALLPSLGSTVRTLREQASLSRRALSAASGLSERFLADLEGGTGNISVHRLEQLAAALHTSASALLLRAERAAGAAPAPLAKLAAIDPQLAALLAGLAPDERREADAWLRARFARGGGPLVALLGLRGAGKSTVGRLLAARLAVPFVELDERVEAAAGLTLAGIFAFHGEAYYRRLAREVLARLLAETDAAVIATGGSIVTDREALRLLAKRCRTVWLQATPEDHWQRVLDQGDERPGAASGNAQAELRALLEARAPLYAQAELRVDTSRLGVEGSVASVLAGLAGRARL